MNFQKVILLLFYFISVTSFAQVEVSDDLQDQLPIDHQVKIGKLKNGLTYYIRQNGKPENRVELRLAINAGSLLENDDQQGLAHFLEHMCFNGTENFEKNDLVSYLQSIGVKFGADLNAYTSFDETVYILPVPTDKPGIVDSAFMILSDWAGRVSLNGEDIDSERGVVIEEWRLGRGASQRMRDQWFPVLLNNSRYAERLPIGKKEILENFSHETIRDFYNDWYRPDLMAVIVVGDIDVDEMEQKIIANFESLENPKKPRERTEFDVPKHEQTLAKVVSDKENSFTQVYIFNKFAKEDMVKLEDYKKALTMNLYTTMLNSRLAELRQKPEPPFIYGVTFSGGFVRPINNFASFANVSEDGIEKGLKAMAIENERAKLHGFNPSELKRAKKEIYNQYEKTFNERDKRESANLVQEYLGNFLEKEAIPGIEYEFAFVQKYLESITLDEVNALSNKFMKDENRVIVVTAPDKDGLELPTEEQVIEWFTAVKSMTIAHYEEKDLGESLLEEEPLAGRVLFNKELKDVDSWELKLSNGAKVILKTTDFKNDEILFNAVSPGGHSLANDEDYYSAETAATIVRESGYGNFSSTDLQKFLAGKTVSVTPYIGSLEEGIDASCSPKDLETMLQLVHLAFTSPRKDEDVFASYITKNKALYKNLLSNPNYYFLDKTSKFMSQGNPRGGGLPTTEDLDKINLETAIDFYKDRFSDVSDFTFFMVGNFNIDEVKPLLEKYIASLPSQSRKESWNDLGIRPPEGVQSLDVKKGTDPKSSVNITFHNTYDFDLATNYKLSALTDVLDIKLIELLREEIGGVYGVGSYASANRDPYENYRLVISFPCAPENVDKLVNSALDEVKRIQQDGIDDADVQKVKEQKTREMEVRIKENSYWAGALEMTYKYGLEPSYILNYQQRIDNINAADLQEAAQKYFDFDSYAKMVLYPENWE